MGKRLQINFGDKYGRLTIVKEIERHITPSGQIKRKVKCICDCGNIIDTQLNRLINGSTTSCGCYNKEIVSMKQTTHGLRNSSEYNIWCHMKSRCYNTNVKRYQDWGGRGITVCDRWKNSFENFIQDMGKRPTSFHSIDRKDNNGNYEPSNCRWATKIEQSQNKRPYKKK